MKTKQSSKLSDYLKAINDENRLAILTVLKKGPLCVCEIFPLLNLSQNLVSHHLKVLRTIGLIKNKREGIKIIYSRDEDTIIKFQILLSNTIQL